MLLTVKSKLAGVLSIYMHPPSEISEKLEFEI